MSWIVYRYVSPGVCRTVHRGTERECRDWRTAQPNALALYLKPTTLF